MDGDQPESTVPRYLLDLAGLDLIPQSASRFTAMAPCGDPRAKLGGREQCEWRRIAGERV